MDKIIDVFIQRIRSTVTLKEYDEVIRDLNQSLRDNGYSDEICKTIKFKQKYIKNKFSDEINREKMEEAKENLLEYLSKMLEKERWNDDIVFLKRYLQNFHMFLEALFEREPDKRATLTAEMLQKVRIENEYDLQHLLYAFLKPLYTDIRKEVAGDSGIGMVRSDLKIPNLNLVVEAKCTREKMNVKKLTEEIEADIVHYQEENILFYVYDKEKIIKEKLNYENYFNRVFDHKNVNIIIQQPINLL